MISVCQSAKEISKALQTAHEGTIQVKQSKIDMLTTEYELFSIENDESIQDMHTRFTSIINELHSLAKDLQSLTIDKLVGNLKTYEMKRTKDSERREPKKEKNLVLKAESNDSTKRNPVPNKRFKRKNAADNAMKQALTAWGDSSSEYEEETDADDDEDDDNDKVNFRDVQRNQKSYSPKKLMSLTNVLIDAYHSLVDDKNALTIELGDAEQTKDDLVVCVVDLKEIVDNLENEKKVLTEKITSVEHERDDLMVVVVDLKETIENFSKEKDILVEKVTVIEQERDDLLIVTVDIREIIEELRVECRPGNYEKGKEVASKAYIKLENELNVVRTSLCAELEKYRQLQAELERVKNNLEKFLKWTWSSDANTAMYVNNGGNREQ
ncbi:intracellular protein transport protein USO1-like [Nicotiana sylvestris]|uniref:intracellular protein transport protein USO1-like n=1 Tax=Nicotiana sylvestris TaxID=4096 RepID=UPI00388CCEE9